MPTRYAANSILAKVRTKYGKALTAQNYRDMAALPGVADVAAYLKSRTKYRTALADVRESAVHRGNLERILRTGFLNELTALCKFDRGVGDPFFSCIMVAEELDRLKMFLRCLSAGRTAMYAEVAPGAVATRICVNTVELFSVSDYGGMLKCITDAALRRILEQFEATAGGTFDTMAATAAIDKYRYKYQSAIISRSYSGSTRAALEEMLRTKAELDNLRMLVRGKNYFSAPPYQLRALMIPARARLSAKDTDRLIDSASPDEIADFITKKAYAKGGSLGSAADIDEFARRVLYNMYRRTIRMTTSPAVVMYCYVGLTHIEIENITTVIEGVRYGMDAETITGMLIYS